MLKITQEKRKGLIPKQKLLKNPRQIKGHIWKLGTGEMRGQGGLNGAVYVAVQIILPQTSATV